MNCSTSDIAQGIPANIGSGVAITGQTLLVKSLQFDEEFTARQEAQAELQKREEKIKELEAEVKQLRTQVIKHIAFNSTAELIFFFFFLRRS